MGRLFWLRVFLFLSVMLELLGITYFRNFAGPWNSPVYLLGSAVAIGLLYYFVSGMQRKEFSAMQKENVLLRAAGVLFFALLSIAVFFSMNDLIREHPVVRDQTQISDVIPQTMELVNREWVGEYPYHSMEMGGYSLFPTYMPLQWLPYVVAKWLQLDFRWFACIILWLVLVIIYLHQEFVLKRGVHFFGSAALFIWFLWMQYDAMPFAYTLEPLIAAYYIFTLYCIGRSKMWLLAIGVGMCLLSRYSLVLWLPLLAMVYTFRFGVRKVGMAMAIVTGMVICFYWLPFFRHDPGIFTQAYAYHTKAALDEWQLLNTHGNPVHLFQGLGMAAWGFTYYGGSIAERLHTWQLTHLLVSSGVILFFAGLYIRRRKNIPAETYMRMSLKIYLSVFYLFIQIPYDYLFLVPVMCSGILLSDAMGRENKKGVTDTAG